VIVGTGDHTYGLGSLSTKHDFHNYQHLILLRNILLFLNVVKHTKIISKTLKIQDLYIFFSPASVVDELLAILYIFDYVKVAKYVWHSCCHLVAETGS
jgi:hypothetical protein